MDTSKIGKIDGLTLTDALRLLHDHARQADRADHRRSAARPYQRSRRGNHDCLKSTNEPALNQPGVVNLMLVMSGSDRDKLLRLVNTAGAPFYGSQIQRMPPLGPDFIAHIAALIGRSGPNSNPVDQTLLQQAFEVFGFRPQFSWPHWARCSVPSLP